MIHVGIVGASGYAGAELMRLLGPRPDVCIDVAAAGTSAGARVPDLYPFLQGIVDLTLEPFDPARCEGLDVVFVALPSGEGMKAVPPLIEGAARIIDLGGDFRLPDPGAYERFYGRPHECPRLLDQAVYGLPELNREAIGQARLVANPGCYPTSALLALLPVLKAGVVSPQGIVITSVSGVSGAGRSSSVDMSFAEVNENVRAYKVGRHQHIPEIHAVLEAATGTAVSLSFVPHLVPLTRGIYTTIHAQLLPATRNDDVLDTYRTFYADAPFVRVRTTTPQIRDVTYTNFCDIGATREPRTNQLIIISTIDNLVKGAAGQAVQNMNIMLGLPEDTGLGRREIQHVY